MSLCGAAPVTPTRSVPSGGATGMGSIAGAAVGVAAGVGGALLHAAQTASSAAAATSVALRMWGGVRNLTA